MKKVIQNVVQVIFLVLFLVLVITGNVQLWMGLFVAGVIISMIFGRLYCGWVCPINTVMKVFSWLKRKLSIKSHKTPKFLTKAWIRYVVLGLFIAVFVFTLATGKKMPILPALFVIGIALNLVFTEELWHRYLCPYGTIFSLAAKKSRYSMRIDDAVCTNCGSCQRACPAGAIDNNSRRYMIKKEFCIVCRECSKKCIRNAISYKGSADKIWRMDCEVDFAVLPGRGRSLYRSV